MSKGKERETVKQRECREIEHRRSKCRGLQTSYIEKRCKHKNKINKWIVDESKLFPQPSALILDGPYLKTSTELIKTVPQNKITVIEMDEPTISVMKQNSKVHPIILQNTLGQYIIDSEIIAQNIIYADYMCSYKTNSRMSPMDDISDILSKAKSDELLICLTFTARSNSSGNGRKSHEIINDHLKAIFVDRNYTMVRGNSYSYKRRMGQSMLFFMYKVKKAELKLGYGEYPTYIDKWGSHRYQISDEMVI
jgi:hypothetical protein